MFFTHYITSSYYLYILRRVTLDLTGATEGPVQCRYCSFRFWQCRETCIRNQSRCLLLAICMPWAPLRCLRPQRPHLMTKVWHRSSSGAIYPSKVFSGRSTRAPLFQRVTRWLYLLHSFLQFLRGFKQVSLKTAKTQIPKIYTHNGKITIYPTKGPFMSCSKAARILGTWWNYRDISQRSKRRLDCPCSPLPLWNWISSNSLELWWKFHSEHFEQRQELFLLVVVEIAWTSRW